MKTTRAIAFSLAAVLGAAVGWYLAGRHLEHHKADLFSPHRLRRLAALNYLVLHGNADTVQPLRDYIAWEPTAALRWRAQRLVGNLEAALA